MKTIARSFAATIVLAGFIATFHPQAKATSAPRATRATAGKMPIPVCPPNDPNACGIDKW